MAQEAGLSNRDRVLESGRQKMAKHGVGLKQIEAFKSSRRRVRKRGGVREPRVVVRDAST